MSAAETVRRWSLEAELDGARRAVDRLGGEKEVLLGRIDVLEREVRMLRELRDAAVDEARRLRRDCPVRRLAGSASGGAAAVARSDGAAA